MIWNVSCGFCTTQCSCGPCQALASLPCQPGPSKREYWDAVSQTTIYIHKIIRLEFLASLLLLCGAWEPLLDKKSGPLWKVLWILMTEGAEQQGTTTTRIVGVTYTPFLCSRSCCNRLFLITAFCFTMQSSRRVCKNAVVISISCGLDLEGLVGVKRSVSSVSHEGCSFLGAPGGCLFSFSFSFSSFSSFSSTSANPVEWFKTGIGESCPVAPTPASAAFGGGLLGWQGLLF